MLEIKNIYLKNENEKTRLYFNIDEDGIEKNTWFEVNNEYAKYLCYERCDAIVIGLLSYAMRGGHDIKSQIPITEELLYNINTYLIPVLVKYDKSLYKTQIIADTAENIKSEGAVGTGLSCGVDSFHAVLNHLNSKYKKQNITHVCINSVGSFGEWYKDTEGSKTTCFNRAQKVAGEINIPLISTNSNFAESFIQDHLLTNTYSSVYAIYCLQKLWGIYYYSSCHDYGHFSLKNNSKYDTSYYDLLLLDCFSIKNLRLYSEGSTKDRLEKVESIADNKLVQKYLHVCGTKGINCGTCLKCRRTILELYTLNKLDKFREAFNVDYFYKHKLEYFIWLYQMHLIKDNINEPTYQAIKKEISIFAKVLALISGAYLLARKYVRRAIRRFQKK